MEDYILFILALMGVVLCAWAIQRMLGPTVAPSDTVAPLPEELHRAVRFTGSAPAEARDGERRPPRAQHAPAVVPTSHFVLHDLEPRLIHRRPVSRERVVPLHTGDVTREDKAPLWIEEEISREELVIPTEPFLRHAQLGRHHFFMGAHKTLVEIWEIGTTQPQLPYVESLRQSLFRWEELFDQLENPVTALTATAEILEGYFSSPIDQFRSMARSLLEEYLSERDVNASSVSLVEGGADLAEVGQMLADQVLYWGVHGRWCAPLQVGVLSRRRHEWVAAGIWPQVMHLLGRLVLLAPYTRRIHGRAAGTWAQLRGVLKELVTAHLSAREYRDQGMPSDEVGGALPVADLEDILHARHGWPAWKRAAGRRNLWRVVEPLAAVEPGTTRLGFILEQMRHESWEPQQLLLAGSESQHTSIGERLRDVEPAKMTDASASDES